MSFPCSSLSVSSPASGHLKTRRPETNLASSVIILTINLPLNDAHVVLEVIVLEVLVLLLVVGGLVKIGLADAIHNVDTLLQALDRLVEVFTEAEVVRVVLDFLESLKLQL